MQYQKLLGYERGPDGKPQIVPEQAEIVRFIYQRYLAGDPLRSIKEQLEAQGCLTAAGKSKWVISNIKSILTNEKYCGDALLQKTFIKDCISKKVIPNTGQLTKSSSRSPRGHRQPGAVRCCSAGDGPTEGAGGRNQEKLPHRTAEIQREICPQQSAVLRRVRHSLPPVHLDPARGKAACVALCQPVELRKEILPAFSNIG